MNYKTLGILAMMAVMLGGVAMQLTQKTPITTEKAKFMPQLATKINDVTEVQIEDKANDRQWHFVLQNSKWGSTNGYPLEFDKLRPFLAGLVDWVKLEPKTSNPDLYARLQVEDFDAPTAKSTHLLLKDKEGHVIADWLVGKNQVAKTNKQLREIYVREAGDKASWLVMGAWSLPYSKVDWLQRDLVDIEKSALQQVNITLTNGDNYTLKQEKQEKPEEQHFIVENQPTDSTDSPQPIASTLSQIGEVLSSLRLNGVKPVAEVDFTQANQATYRTFDGLVVQIDTVKVDDATYAKIAAQAHDEAQQTAAEALNAKLSGWAFELPTFKAEGLTKSLSDLFPEPEASAEPSIEALLDAAATPGTVK